MLDISQLSQRSGFPASKLRYYEEMGLIQSAGRKGLKRIYEPEVETRLSLIALAQTAGFSLGEIKTMLVSEGPQTIDHTSLRAKADSLTQTIKELTALRDGLLHVMQCEAEDQLACPRFQRIMRVALAKKTKPRPKHKKHPIRQQPDGSS